MDSGLFTRMDASCLSLVRAARLGPWLDNQLVALGRAGFARFAGFASRQGRNQQLRPTGWGLQESDSAALGGGGGQAIRRNVACRHYLSQRFKPCLSGSLPLMMPGGSNHRCRDFYTWEL